MSQLKSAMKSAKKRGRTAKENVPLSAVRSSSRKRNHSADASLSGTVARSSSRARTRGLVDANNLETPANGRYMGVVVVTCIVIVPSSLSSSLRAICRIRM